MTVITDGSWCIYTYDDLLYLCTIRASGFCRLGEYSRRHVCLRSCTYIMIRRCNNTDELYCFRPMMYVQRDETLLKHINCVFYHYYPYYKNLNILSIGYPSVCLRTKVRRCTISLINRSYVTVTVPTKHRKSRRPPHNAIRATHHHRCVPRTWCALGQAFLLYHNEIDAFDYPRYWVCFTFLRTQQWHRWALACSPDPSAKKTYISQ